MTDLRTAAQQALEALEVATTPLAKDRQEVLRAQAALRAALAEPVQEPVAWMGAHDKTDLYFRKPPQADVVPLYTAPPERAHGIV